MIEERAVVRRVEHGAVWVQAYGPHNCERCASGQGCGGGILSRLVGHRRPDIRVRSSLEHLRAGDTIVIGIDEDALISASLWAYAVPLLAMFACGAFAHLVLQASDILVALFALTGLMGALVGLRSRAARVEVSDRYRPVALRKDTAVAEHCARL